MQTRQRGWHDCTNQKFAIHERSASTNNINFHVIIYFTAGYRELLTNTLSISRPCAFRRMYKRLGTQAPDLKTHPSFENIKTHLRNKPRVKKFRSYALPCLSPIVPYISWDHIAKNVFWRVEEEEYSPRLITCIADWCDPLSTWSTL